MIDVNEKNLVENILRQIFGTYFKTEIEENQINDKLESENIVDVIEYDGDNIDDEKSIKKLFEKAFDEFKLTVIQIKDENQRKF